MLFLLFIALSFADKCTYDEHRDNTDYYNNENYHERYCATICPCNIKEDPTCEMDFTSAPMREMENVTGSVNELVTRNYEYTFAFNVKGSFSAEKVLIKSGRVHYKLADGASLTIKDQVASEDISFATGNTIIRCAGKCTVNNSKFPKRKDESISFIADGDNSAVYKVEQNTFQVSFESDEFSQNYVRENVNFESFVGNNFVVIDDEAVVNANANKPIPLFYSATSFPENVEKDNVITVAGSKSYSLKLSCGGKWLTGVPDASVEYTECVDPTVTKGSKSLEEGCNIAFIVVIVLADTTLLLVVLTFVVLLLLPLIKRKLGKGEYSKI